MLFVDANFLKFSANLKIWLWWISPTVGGLSKNMTFCFGGIGFFFLYSSPFTVKVVVIYNIHIKSYFSKFSLFFPTFNWSFIKMAEKAAFDQFNVKFQIKNTYLSRPCWEKFHLCPNNFVFMKIIHLVIRYMSKTWII